METRCMMPVLQFFYVFLFTNILIIVFFILLLFRSFCKWIDDGGLNDGTDPVCRRRQIAGLNRMSSSKSTKHRAYKYFLDIIKKSPPVCLPGIYFNFNFKAKTTPSLNQILPDSFLLCYSIFNLLIYSNSL